ncbi:MAG: efflux RND transporter permease subunit, partial [Ketobacteraceae bacterium]|nr:efflux RND transporter permease subunit [Ketobacteraceae bacterium]
MQRYIEYFLKNRFLVLLFVAFVTGAGVIVAPFDWQFDTIERHPVPVDAIPDISENQQIVFTRWPGRSPSDVDDQVTYPLTVSLLGLPGVKTVRSYSNFGFSLIYVIFEEDIEFYWSRSRILEKLNSLPSGTLPDDVVPSLGPDATALGQVFWYTLEGRDKDGNPAGGWDLDELRSIQDWVVRYALMSASGVAEVASVGGFVREYQVDVDPDAMRAYGVSIEQIFNSIRRSNSDVSARTIEVNNVEYMIRGVGFINGVEDLENIAVTSRNNTPVRIRDVAHITLGPALRRGVLDKAGSEAVGGVAVVRFGDNPLQVIKNLKEKIDLIAPGLPEKTLADGTVSKVTIVPFYDRTELIYETLNTLNDAIEQQILITLLVVVIMVLSLRTSFIIGLMLPLTVLMTFILMKLFRVDANIVALSGIAIAVGTIVDMGIVLCENILRHFQKQQQQLEPAAALRLVASASHEVAGAVTTAALTTIVSFLPVFTMIGAEGKLFTPLAFTKTFALICSIILAVTVLPTLALIFYGPGGRQKVFHFLVSLFALVFGAALFHFEQALAGTLLILAVLLHLFEKPLSTALKRDIKPYLDSGLMFAIVLLLTIILADVWQPLGPGRSAVTNFLFVALTVFTIIGALKLFQHYYEPLLRWSLKHKITSLAGSVLLVIFGTTCWLGFESSFRWLPDSVAGNKTMNEVFPGIGKEFMPALNEGSFLYMPTTMPHAALSEVTDILQTQDMAINAIPEVKRVVGKLGRAESPLDPAPISMIETVITYHPEWALGSDGERGKFRYDEQAGEFVRDTKGNLIEDPDGRYYRNWRDHIRSPDDIWQEIVKAAQVPGTTGAPKLQPIETRIVMLQSGFRAPMGIKVYGPSLEAIESFSLALEQALKKVPGIKPETVFAERIVGKPYLEIHIDRERIARYGIHLQSVQEVIEVAIGGKRITTTVEGRERYPVRVRYMRELRDQIESLGDILI